jgi:hypothetical protein
MNEQRKIDYLNKHRIIYRRDPINDKPTEVYTWGKFFEGGTYECYTLFDTSAKINTYKSLRWHLYVLWYLNHNMSQDKFESIARYIADKNNGFVSFYISGSALDQIIYDVSMMDLESPPSNKMRKIIFNDTCGLTPTEKLKIVGSLIGKKKILESDIYEAMLFIHDNREKITIKRISSELGCSDRTIIRNMSNELKKEKKLLNDQL